HLLGAGGPARQGEHRRRRRAHSRSFRLCRPGSATADGQPTGAVLSPAAHRKFPGGRPVRALFAGLVLLSVSVFPALSAPGCLDGDGYHASLYAEAGLFEEAIAREAAYPPSQSRITGITAPHHLVAAHLIARGFKAASGRSYSRVILLTPDHFFRSGTPFATTSGSFHTPFGPVEIDREAVARIMGDERIAESCLFAREHGIHALLPFMRHYLPDATLVPIAISLKANRADWDRLVEILAPL